MRQRAVAPFAGSLLPLFLPLACCDYFCRQLAAAIFAGHLLRAWTAFRGLQTRRNAIAVGTPSPPPSPKALSHDAVHLNVSIPRQSRGLYDGGPSQGPPRNPSSGFLPQPPSPQGRRKRIHSPLSPRERVSASRRTGEGSVPQTPPPSRRLLPERSNFYCLHGRAGGSPK